MSEEQPPTRSPTMTDLLRESGDDAAQYRLKTFQKMMQEARAYQIILKQEGAITEQECTSIIQGYGHIEHEIIQEDASFCCGQCGHSSLHFFSNDDGLCVWCVEANKHEDEQKKTPQPPTWNDSNPDLPQAVEDENVCICADCGNPAPQWIEDPHHNNLEDCPHPLGIWADCSEGECGTITGVEFDAHDLPQFLGGQGTNCDLEFYLRHFPESYTCTLEEYVACLREERDEA